MNDFMILPVHKGSNKNRGVEYFVAIQKDVIHFSSESEALKFAHKQRIVSGQNLPISSIAVKNLFPFFLAPVNKKFERKITGRVWSPLRQGRSWSGRRGTSRLLWRISRTTCKAGGP